MAKTNQNTDNKGKNNRTLPPLEVGKRVHIQNHATNKWDRSGTIMEALDHRKYTVKMDGSGRLSKRNRRHLKVAYEGHTTTNADPNNPTTVVVQQATRPTRNRRRTERYAP